MIHLNFKVAKGGILSFFDKTRDHQEAAFLTDEDDKERVRDRYINTK